MPSDLSAAQLERAKRVILQYPEVHRYQWVEDCSEDVEPQPKRAKAVSGKTLPATGENMNIVARLIEFLSRWQARSPSARTHVANMRVRHVRNRVRGEYRPHIPPHGDPMRLPCHDDDQAAQEIWQELFRRPGEEVGGFLDDGHVVFAGLELKLLTPDVIRECGREHMKRRQNQAKEDAPVDFYDLDFSPGPEAKSAMGELFWGGRDFEWVVPDEKVNENWKTVNKRVRYVRYCSFARQSLHLTDDTALLQKLLKPFGPDQVFIPETARICLATCALSLITQRYFGRQTASELAQDANPAEAVALASGSTARKGRPNENGVLESYIMMMDALRLVVPGSEATGNLAGYERCLSNRDVLQSFFAPESAAEPLQISSRDQQQGNISLYNDLGTIYLPLLAESGRKDDTSPDLSHVIAVLVANPCFDVLPPVIFIDYRFAPVPDERNYIGTPPRS